MRQIINCVEVSLKNILLRKDLKMMVILAGMNRKRKSYQINSKSRKRKKKDKTWKD
jgi:hypothetical protein